MVCFRQSIPIQIFYRLSSTNFTSSIPEYFTPDISPFNTWRPLKGYTYVNKTNQAAGLSTPSTRVKLPTQRTNHKVNKESRNKENKR